MQAQWSTTPPRGNVKSGPRQHQCGGDSATAGATRLALSNYASYPSQISLCSSRLPQSSPGASRSFLHLAAGGARWDKSDLSTVRFSARALFHVFFFSYLSVASTWSATGRWEKGDSDLIWGWIAGPARGRCLDCPHHGSRRAHDRAGQCLGLLTRFRFNCWCFASFPVPSVYNL